MNYNENSKSDRKPLYKLYEKYILIPAAAIFYSRSNDIRYRSGCYS